MARAQVALGEKRADAAVDALKHIPDDDALAPRAWLLIGQTELRRNRAKDSESAFLKALELDPTLVQAHRELIFIYGMQLRRNDLKEQFRALSELTELTYDNVFHWCLLRNCLWEPGEVAQTLSAFLEADPSDRQSRLALADNYRRLGLFDEADQSSPHYPRTTSECSPTGSCWRWTDTKKTAPKRCWPRHQSTTPNSHGFEVGSPSPDATVLRPSTTSRSPTSTNPATTIRCSG